MSGSMKGTLAQAESAVRAFLDTANPEDEGFLYSVSSRPGRDAGFTGNLDSLLGEAGLAQAHGSTALIDTVYCGLDAMHSARRPRRALLIVSDGMDNHSRYSKTELLERALEADVQIFTIAVDSAAAYEKAITLAEQRQGITLLQDLAEKTGGLSFVIRNPEDMGKAALAISRAIRNEYTIGYAPGAGARDGKWHTIRVRSSMPQVRVYARSGYYAQ
jgi:Ca-activated chloride channel family protein